MNARNSKLDNILRRMKIQWYYQKIFINRDIIYQRWRIYNHEKWLHLISNVNKSMSS